MTSFPLFISCCWVLFCAHSFSSCLSSSDCSHLFSSLLSSSLLFSPLLSSSPLVSPLLTALLFSALVNSSPLVSLSPFSILLSSSHPSACLHSSSILFFGTSQLFSPSLSSSHLISALPFSSLPASSPPSGYPQVCSAHLFSDRLCKTENSSSTQAHIHRGAATPVRFAGPDCKTPWNYMHRRKKEQQHAPTPMQFSSGKLQKAQHYARAPLQPRATSMQPHRCDLQAPSCKFG